MFLRISPRLNVILLLANTCLLLILLNNLRYQNGTTDCRIPDNKVANEGTRTLIKSGVGEGRSSSPTPSRPATRKHSHDKQSQDGHPMRKWNHDWDGREHQWLWKNYTPVNREIFLIRHGQYHREAPPAETHLTELGKKQAERTGQRLKDMNMTFTRFISSTSLRAKETANILHKYIHYLPITWSDLLKEGWPTFPEPAFPLWDPNHPAFRMDSARISQAFSTYFHRADPSQTKESTEIVVAHGNVIAYLTLRLLQLDRERWLRLGVHQCSITRLWIHPDGLVTFKAIGDVGHLPKHEWTD